uniref:Uncharacterized protein n=1 Tax=Anopheles atroparvus TaxID=41427 RepID=A0A182IP09_ANOAO
MLTKRIFAFSALPAFLRLGALLLGLGPVAHGQYLSSPCPAIFSYRLDQSTNQVFGYVELQNLRIGQVVKLNVDLSIGVAVPQNNVGSIVLVKSREQTFRDIYNNQPAQYRVNFPFSNVIPSVLAISVNGQTICTGQKATGQIVTTINLEHTLFTQMQPLSNGNGNNVNAIQFQPVQQTPPPIHTPPVQVQPQHQPQAPVVQTWQPQNQPRPRPVNRPQVFQTPRPQPQSTVPVEASSGSLEECGKPAAVYSRLSINGQHSPKGQFPWAVPVFIDQGASKKPKYICGSTIISKNHLVTAGHCMYEDNKERQATDLLTAPGMYNIDNFFETDIQMGYVASIVVHPDYYTDDYGKTENDIALMVLRQTIIYNDLVRPICLWNGNDNIEDIVGLTGYVSGWGVTENGSAKKPSYVNAKVVAKNECRRKLGSIFSEKEMFCADGNGSVPCTGDSGSGLVLKQGSRFYIRGIVSIGQFDPITLLCDTGKYVVYTDIAPFRFWLKNEMNTKVNK